MMSDPDLVPLLGARFVRSSEKDIVSSLIQNDSTPAETDACASAGAQPSMSDPNSFTQHPISQDAAFDLCERLVGIGRPSRYHRWVDCLPVWWERLRNAPTAEEKLTCERMINALNRAAGMHVMEYAARLVARNKARIDREQADKAAAEKAAEEAAAIDRWR